mmetsp:Transcript_8311/g.24986  ORF Transcript_8311/g.24986 Transcript_8311/m.24986 type:complete len:656 (+) Transcript_8311:241-2208(+)
MNVYSTSRGTKIVVGAGAGVLTTAGILVVKRYLVHAQVEQKRLAGETVADGGGKRSEKKQKIGINSVFVRRLEEILRICVPKLLSREAGIIAIQSVLLLARTLITDIMARVEGQCAESITTMNWPGFGRAVVKFAILSAPASIVNAGLKMFQALMSISFRWRLSHHLHKAYMTNRAYYAANVLSGLSNADQRITEDVEKFCSLFAELFSYTFKPILDILIFTTSMSRVIGWRGQIGLYMYFIFCSFFLRKISPPLGLMTAQESALSGNLRSAHARVKASAEEIAFNDPPGGDAERRSLDSYLRKLLKHMTLSSVQRFIQGCADGYFVKYTASIIGLSIFALPFYLNPGRLGGKNLTNEYIQTIKLMMNTSAAVGQLVLAYKRILQLAGHTARVSELFEQVKQMSETIQLKFSQSRENVNAQGLEHNGELVKVVVNNGHFVDGDFIRFEGVTLHTPDGTLLLKDLTFNVERGTSVIILGPNGSGKSSLLRVLAELWPLENGKIMRPRREDIYFLSQRPYIYSGTLREQLLYPRLLRKAGNEELSECLEKVGISYLLDRYGWDKLESWDELLSGGERQRLAMARLLFHNPKFAVLDECTSAVSADGEQNLYEVCTEAGITMLSIAHRPTVKKYHQAAIILDGNHSWRFSKLKDGEEV